jgi:molecular chaperone DnaK (HSP70)
MIFGIDYGTTHSSIGIFYNNKIELLKKNNQVKFDSTIFTKDNLFYYDKNDSNLFKIRKIKRYLNQISMEKDDFIITENNKEYSLNFLLSQYFDYLISIIKVNFPNEKIQAVITVPSYFNHHQRNFIKNLWLEKNVEIIRIISEPSAAVLGYYHYHPSNQEIKKVMTFDEGGGTLDISILEKDDEIYHVIDHQGDLFLGGEDFTEEIKNYYKISWEKAEERKLLNNPADAISYRNQLDKIRKILEKLKENHNFEEIDQIIMVGRGSKLIGIINLLESYFPNKIRQSPEQDNLVVLGASLYGEILNPNQSCSSEIIMVDSTPLSIGIETADKNFSIIIPRNSVLPALGTKKYLPAEDEDEITLKIYQGEKGLAEENALIEIIDIPANPNVFIDSVYKITLKLDLNGIIFLKLEDLNDKTYTSERILKHKKIDDINKYEKTIEDIEEYNKRSELFLLNQLIFRIKSNLTFAKMEDELKLEIENYFNQIQEEIRENYHLNLILKYKKEIEEEYGHLQYHQEAEDFQQETNDYSKQWKQDFLESKLKGFLDLISLSESVKDLVNSLLEKLKNKQITLEELEERIEEIEQTLSYDNHYEELKELVYYFDFQLSSEESLPISEENKVILKNELDKLKIILENKELYDFEKLLNDFNSFCEKIL